MKYLYYFTRRSPPAKIPRAPPSNDGTSVAISYHRSCAKTLVSANQCLILLLPVELLSVVDLTYTYILFIFMKDHRDYQTAPSCDPPVAFCHITKICVLPAVCIVTNSILLISENTHCSCPPIIPRFY